MVDCKHNDCIFYPNRTICCLAEVIQSRTIDCPNYERENMSNIKITAEVDGKQVPLETISIETFEAIKALEEPKEIPVARIGYYSNSEKRLILEIDNYFRDFIINHKNVSTIAINLKTGEIVHWDSMGIYSNIRPL